jgi:hypothetical protein
MSAKKRPAAMIKLFSLKRFLASQLRKKIDKLQHRAAKRTAKLEQAKAEAEAKHDHDHDHTN